MKIEKSNSIHEILKSNHFAFLGGDFDNKVIDFLLSEFKAESGIDLKNDVMAMQRLKEAVENAKKELSSAMETTINLPFISTDATGPKHLTKTLTRAKFESMIDESNGGTHEKWREWNDEYEQENIMTNTTEQTNQALETQLFHAVTQDEKQKVQNILKQQPELINFVFENEKSVFELAIEHGYSTLAKELIKFPNFDLNLSEHNPLRISIIAGYEDIATILLEKGANPNHYQEKSGSILWLCLENGYFELAELLLVCGAEIDVRDEKGWTILIYAAYNGLDKIVDFLLKHKASVNIRNNDGWSAIVGAYAMNKINIVEKLKNHGAKFNEKYSQAALLNSVVNGHLQIAKLLVEQGVNPNISDKNHGSLLHIAALKRDYDFIQSLLEKGANPNIKDNDGNPPIYELARNGCNGLISLFVQYGADVNLTNNYGNTPIITAALHNQIETVQLLCDLGANINHQGNNKNTALIFAVQRNYTNMVKKLMELGANPELYNNNDKKADQYKTSTTISSLLVQKR